MSITARIKGKREEEIKGVIGKEFFDKYDYTAILGNIDFCVGENIDADGDDDDSRINYLWAEAKRSNTNVGVMLSQLILTIGRAKAFEKYLPPYYLGVFDNTKMAFVPYNGVMEFFHMNDFDWTVTPSDHSTKEFQKVLERVTMIIDEQSLVFRYDTDEKELRQFIKKNFQPGSTEVGKIRITKNNFINIYYKWVENVREHIGINIEKLKARNIVDGDFYLADLLADKDMTIKDSLAVVLNHKYYEIKKGYDQFGDLDLGKIEFLDKQRAYYQFWNKYERPPKEEYWDYIIERRDLLVPQDIRERKGSFFTPRIWVEKAQEYLSDYFGENYQDEYYIWDCAAGTGNLMIGLTNRYRIFASTLDISDVQVMKDRIDNGGFNMLKEHVFQFDFLNDDLKNDPRIPQTLKDIIADPKKRRKLIILINPPYAEAGTAKTITGTGEHKSGTSINNRTYEKYRKEIGPASNELFAQFFIRIYKEIPNCYLAEFSTLKILQGPNFSKFRSVFRAVLEKLFLVPGNTFDNVKGQFPIGFFIWDLSKKEVFEEIIADVYDKHGRYIGPKRVLGKPGDINKWIAKYKDLEETRIATIGTGRNDFQHNNLVHIRHYIADVGHSRPIYPSSLHACAVCLAVRHCIKATWLNDRDQFYYPKAEWEQDTDFISDCLAFTLFHPQNQIRSDEGVNHWIPFAEEEVNAPALFQSHFMQDYIKGKIETTEATDLFAENYTPKPITFTTKAQTVIDAGRELYRYYFQQKGTIKPNASFYDIREYFQGRNAKGHMNPKSNDEEYTRLLTKLKAYQKALAKDIAEKAYQYAFLK